MLIRFDDREGRNKLSQRESLGLQLGRNEIIIKELEYVKQGNKEFSSSASLTLTNYRLIHKISNVEKKKDKVSIDEVLIKNIDSIEYGVAEGKLPISIVGIIIFILAIIGGVVVGIMLNKLYGIALGVAGLLVLLLCIFLRKKTSAFFIDIYTYNELFDHLTLKGIDLDAKKQRKKRKKAKTKKVKVEKPKKDTVEVAINIEEIKKFVNELGAYLCDLKEAQHGN